MQADRTNEIEPTAPVTEQGAAWWILLNEGQGTQADHQAFVEWVTRSPERVAAYLQAAQVAQRVRSPGMQWPDTPVDELIRAASAPHVARLPASDVDAKPVRLSTRLAPRLAFAALLAFIVVAVGFYLYPRTERFETALGEQHSVVLSDGSVVTLNTASAIEVHFDKRQRRITLLAGEAVFQVAHDANRPFEVTAGEVTVRAVGTKFNVDRHLPKLEVTVVEGRVEVSTEAAARVPLAEGEQLTLAPGGAPEVSPANVTVATAWTQRRLIFENQPLGEIVAELNRYNRKAIDIQSAELRGEQITGVFQSNDPASFLAFLERIPGVSVAESADHSRYIVRVSKQP